MNWRSLTAMSSTESAPAPAGGTKALTVAGMPLSRSPLTRSASATVTYQASPRPRDMGARKPSACTWGAMLLKTRDPGPATTLAEGVPKKERGMRVCMLDPSGPPSSRGALSSGGIARSLSAGILNGATVSVDCAGPPTPTGTLDLIPVRPTEAGTATARSPSTGRKRANLRLTRYSMRSGRRIPRSARAATTPQSTALFNGRDAVNCVGTATVRTVPFALVSVSGIAPETSSSAGDIVVTATLTVFFSFTARSKQPLV